MKICITNLSGKFTFTTIKPCSELNTIAGIRTLFGNSVEIAWNSLSNDRMMVQPRFNKHHYPNGLVSFAVGDIGSYSIDKYQVHIRNETTNMGIRFPVPVEFQFKWPFTYTSKKSTNPRHLKK